MRICYLKRNLSFLNKLLFQPKHNKNLLKNNKKDQTEQVYYLTKILINNKTTLHSKRKLYLKKNKNLFNNHQRNNNKRNQILSV